jgi:hypothetical protein
MKILLSALALSVLMSCGGSSSGGGSSSNTPGIIPMVSSINCGVSSCLPSALLKNDAGTVSDWAKDYYDEIGDEIIPEIKSTLKEIDKALALAGITSCESIQPGTSTEINYEGATITVVTKTSQEIDVFNQGTETTKAVEAYNNSAQKFFEAEFNCVSPRVAKIQGDLTLLDPTNFDKFLIHFYEDGNTKFLSMMNNYQGTSSKEGYMVLFNTDGSNYKAYFGYDNDIESNSVEAVLGGEYNTTTGLRIIAATGGTFDFTNDGDTDVVDDISGGGNHEYCYNTSYTPEACAGHPTLGNLLGTNLYLGVAQSTSDGKFNIANTSNLDFSF